MSEAIESKLFIQGTLETLTGLHIGGNSVGLSIGGVNKVVVRNPMTNIPYIPGSSLRGKIRSLLERVRGDETKNSVEGGFSVSKDRKSHLAGKDPCTLLGKLFGVAAENKVQGPTRLIVRDASMTTESYERLKNAPNTDMPLTEVKTEVWIDRITSAANPRQIERVPAGCRFHFEMVLTLMHGDDRKRFLDLVFEGMRLLEADTLGGNGSRGYGQVRFTTVQLLERSAANYRNHEEAKPVPLEEYNPGEFSDQRPTVPGMP